MSYPVAAREPDPFSPPVRAFFDGRSVPYDNLAELRAAMVVDDRELIDFMGARVMKDFELEPLTDLANSARAKVGRIANNARPMHKGFSHLVEAVYGVLAAETSPLISDNGVDRGIIRTIASRTEKAMLATAFKLDPGQGIAPAQQAKNQARAVAIAQEPGFSIHPDYGDFPALVHDVYGVLVPGTANELQQAMFSETYLLPPHYAGMDDWDACLAYNLRGSIPANS